MIKKLISIVIPVYNSEKYLEKCICSILNQTYTNIEVILVDDGSTDASPQICDDFVQRDKRVKALHIPNGGVSIARNVGIGQVTGEYLVFVDSDDYVDEDYLEALLQGTQENNADLCVSSLYPENIRASFDLSITPEYTRELLFLLENHLLFGPFIKLYRASIIKDHRILFPEGISYGEDLIFNLDYLRIIDRISYINYCGYHYVSDNTESLSRKVRWNLFDNEMMLHQKLIDWLKEKNLWTEPFQKYVANRVLDTSYNGLMLFFRSDCTASVKGTYFKVKNIVENPLLRKMLPLADTHKYAGWIVSGMRNRNAMLLTMLSVPRRR